MGNIIKYSTTGVTNTISKGNFYLGVNSNTGGPTDITGFWNGIQPPLSGYTLYGNKNDAFGPSINVFNNDAELISFVNQRGGNVSTISGAINYFSSNDELMLVNKDYESIVTDGLVLNLDASFTPSYPKSGNTWYGLSLSGNNGTLTNGPTFNSGGGGSIAFDGVDDSVDCGVVPSTIYQTFTVSSWVRCTNVGLNNNIVSKNGPYFMRIVSSKLRFNVLTNTGWLFQVGNVTLSNNVWYNLSMVYDGSTWKGYINSNLDFSVSKTGSITTNSTLYIGYTPAAGEQAGFNGNISQTSIYNRSLTTQEILQNYQSTFTRFLGKNIVTSGLVNYLDAGYNASYPGSGTTWNNISGVSGGTGTLVNGPTYSTDGGGSIVFDGVDDTISIPYDTNIDPTEGITIEVWCYPTDLTTIQYQELFRKDSSPGRQLFSFQQYGTILSFGTWTTGYDELDLTILPSNYVNRWNHFVATYRNGYKAIYVNGILLGFNTITGNLTKSNATSYIGSSTNSSEFFKGNYANYKMYNRSLTQSEILQNYQAQLPTIVGENFVTNGLVLYLDAGYRTSYPTTGTTWNNVSGVSGGTGTLTNGPTYNSANGGSIVFDGVDDFVQGTISPSTFTGPHTICCWFYREMIKNWSALFSNNVNTTSCSNFTFIESTNYLGTNQIGVNANSISVDLGSDHLNKWIYGVITYGGNSIGSTVNVYAYKDGNLITASGGLYWNMSASSSFYVGRHYSSEFQIHDGLISNVSVYNRTLTPQEIQQNYNATKSRYVLYKNAYEIKQANPNSPSGIYTISNPGINGGAPTQIYADMETDGGGWTLIMTNSSYLGWTYENSISRNITSPSVATNYSIIGYADALKRSSSGFQYMIDANTRGTWGGIWTANESYSFTSPLNTNTNITLNTKFGTWIYEDNGIEERMPWYGNKATGAAFITTNDIGSGSWWGTLITDLSNWSTAPWIYNGMPTPNFIWYWVR
jgi:hypothetical protein